MSRDPKRKSENSESIQEAIALLLSRNPTKIQAAPALSIAAPPAPTPSKGRRYSPSEKKAILEEAAAGKSSRELFSKYGVSHETVTRWRLRVQKQDERRQDAAENEKKPQGPSTTGSADFSEQVPHDQHKGYHAHWREVLKVWRSRPGLGPAQIRGQLHRVGIKISVATTRKILEENGYTPPKTSVKEVEINRYEAVRPLELVHMDFKHFYINRAKVYLLLLQDDFSRFLCGHRMTDSENMKAVIEVFEGCVGRYGKMQSVMTDAGSAFYSWNGINKFQKILSEEYGIDQIRAKTPRSNGKIENVNRQIEKEVLDVERYASLEEANEAIETWIRFYNFERTHMGLPPGTVPADRFLFGWNRNPGLSQRQEAWTEVLKVAMGEIKRAA